MTQLDSVQSMLDSNRQVSGDNMRVAFAQDRTQKTFVEKIELGVSKSFEKFKDVDWAAMCCSLEIDGFFSEYEPQRKTTTFTLDMIAGLFKATGDNPGRPKNCTGSDVTFKEVSFNISLQGDQTAKFKQDDGFAATVVFSLLQGLVVPLSIMYYGANLEKEAEKAFASGKAWLENDPKAYAKDPETLAAFMRGMDKQTEYAKQLAYFAWSDRFNMYRNLSTGGSEYLPHVEALKKVFNPGSMVNKPAEVAAYARTSDYCVPEKLPEGTDCLVSLSWGKESLLSTTIAQKIYGADSVRFGVIKHDLDDYKYQDSYDKFIAGSPLEGAVNTAAATNYLQLLQLYIPSIVSCGRFCAPTNGLHHIYALSHILNNWDTTSVVFMGDEAERTVDNLVMTNIGEAPQTEDDSLDSCQFMVSKTEVDANDLIENKNLYVPVGVEHTFDFHQSEHMAQALNYYLRKCLKVDKRISSLVYTLNELQIQFLLSELNPELFDYQVSCWFADEPEKHGGSKWCCSCKKCWRLYHMMRCLGLNPENRGLTTNISMADIEAKLSPMLSGGKVFAVDSEPNNISKAIVENNFKVMFDGKLTREAILNMPTVYRPLLSRTHNKAILDLVTEPLSKIVDRILDFQQDYSKL